MACVCLDNEIVNKLFPTWDVASFFSRLGTSWSTITPVLQTISDATVCYELQDAET